jgi:hypothetical protein
MQSQASAGESAGRSSISKVKIDRRFMKPIVTRHYRPVLASGPTLQRENVNDRPEHPAPHNRPALLLAVSTSDRAELLGAQRDNRIEASSP